MYGHCNILLRRSEPIAHNLDRLSDGCRHLRNLILWCHGISLLLPRTKSNHLMFAPLSRKHVSQDERYHPGYDEETQEYF